MSMISVFQRSFWSMRDEVVQLLARLRGQRLHEIQQPSR